jgi:hypothetical protein
MKGLISDGSIGADNFGEVAGVMLDALAGMHEQQSRTLDRIEAKLNRSLQQDFDRSFRMGLFLLRDARNARSSLETRRAALHAARLRFLEGVAGTTSPAQQVQSLHAAAACSLLNGHSETALDELDHAWRIGYKASWEGAEQWEYPTLKGQRPSRLGQFISGSVSRQVWESLDEIEAGILPMDGFLTDVQTLRRLLGVPLHEVPLPNHNRSIMLHFGSARSVLRPLMFIAGSSCVEFPDGVSVKISCDVRQPYPLRQFPKSRGAWVTAEVKADWRECGRYERLRVRPGFDLQGIWKSSATTSPMEPGPVGHHDVRIDVGCTTIEMLLVDVYSAQLNLTSLEMARFEGEVRRAREDAPMLRIAFPAATWSDDSSDAGRHSAL